MCSLPNCYNYLYRSDGISYFSFPKDLSRLKKWLDNCCYDYLNTVHPTILNKRFKLCSLHFSDDMFYTPQKNRLKLYAVPTLFFLSKKVEEQIITYEMLCLES